jgi:hypothetical protein
VFKILCQKIDWRGSYHLHQAKWQVPSTAECHA